MDVSRISLQSGAAKGNTLTAGSYGQEGFRPPSEESFGSERLAVQLFRMGKGRLRGKVPRSRGILDAIRGQASE
jgi:hypothetical protein